MPAQIPLDIALPVSAVFANYMDGSNGLAVSLIQEAVASIANHQAPQDKQLLLWGDSAVGKTHILQAACALAAELGAAGCYLPMAQVKAYGPEVLSGLSQLQLVCIDDVDEVLPDSQWEIAFFNFINECRQSGTLILFSTSAPVSELQVHLADLKSRLSWGAVFEVKQLGDEDKMTWLKTYALNQGLVLQDDVAQYLMSRQQRDMHALVSLIQSLDYASMSEKRKLTLPFVKSVIGC